MYILNNFPIFVETKNKHMNIDNLELVEVSIDKDTFFEGEPFSLEDEYVIIKDGDKEMSIGFNIDIDFKIETSVGDGYITPTFDEIEKVKITFDIIDSDIDEDDVELNDKLVVELEKVLDKFLA